MTESVTTEPVGRALNPVDADHALAVLSRYALAVRAETAPSSVTVANGPLVLRVSWDGQAGPGTPATVAPVPSVAPIPGVPAAADDSASAEKPSDADTFTVNAETVGVFYRAPEPGAAPFVTEGDPVRAGQQVGIVEAMKLMIPVTAAREGRVAEFLVENGEAVEHGAPLMVLEVVR
ncbi:acetyl-CoA carboxylase biotin carboxyl carrier protein subunit [Nocardia amamiensis]|uniref:Biotin carboxyl carrier protein of acetyl-CoA carboxylase n=1 Tax=Nocardia amamiensis TaxID=404578 RepID=A0ABS0CSL2_9NOCA|nr:biotin/lipoyl-containing protein [Nocardia amamiensis]MBF6298848.1 acetyl-CoA carboxylase biotin carboxyl carrier protein subunit [Nocardia amamiensis]